MLRFGRKRSRLSVITLADQARDEGQWQRAAEYYRKALRRRPQNPPIWIQYGHVMKESGRCVEAESAYRRAIAYDPRNADARLQLGRVLKLNGDKEGAQASYLCAVALDPSLPDPLHELGTIGWQPAQLNHLEQLFKTDPPDPSDESETEMT